MNIFVFISAYNEEQSIANVIKGIPKEIEGNPIEILVINDGSTDKTAEVSKAAAAIVVSHEENKGLGVALKRGLIESLERGADIIVHIDADGQYLPSEIPLLVIPIIHEGYDLVLGTRFEKMIYDMPFLKKYGNKFVSWGVRRLTRKNITDAQTGFRAISKPLAIFLKDNLKGTYTYTQEMIIHTVYNDFSIKQVPTTFQERIQGESRLIQHVMQYFMKISRITLTTYQKYKPKQFILVISFSILLLLIVVILIMNFFGVF